MSVRERFRERIDFGYRLSHLHEFPQLTSCCTQTDNLSFPQSAGGEKACVCVGVKLPRTSDKDIIRVSVSPERNTTGRGVSRMSNDKFLTLPLNVRRHSR